MTEHIGKTINLVRESLKHRGVSFIEGDRRMFEQFYDGIQTMSDFLHARPHIPKPPQLFLREPLTEEQINFIDASSLAISYATQGVRAQDQLAKVQIREVGERMAPLEQYIDQDSKATFSSKPYHPSCGREGLPRVFYVRESVAKKLAQVTGALNQIGLHPHIEDAFRPAQSGEYPIGVQEGLFLRRVGSMLAENPNMEWSKVIEIARSKTAYNARLAGHKGGAAVDFMLCNSDGKMLDIGNKYPDTKVLVNMFIPFVTQEQWQNRMIFYTVNTMAGLSVYPWEDWHVSDGDNIAAISKSGIERFMYVARYGPIKSFDLRTGKIQPYDMREINKPFFTKDEVLGYIKANPEKFGKL